MPDSSKIRIGRKNQIPPDEKSQKDRNFKIFWSYINDVYFPAIETCNLQELDHIIDDKNKKKQGFPFRKYFFENNP